MYYAIVAVAAFVAGAILSHRITTYVHGADQSVEHVYQHIEAVTQRIHERIKALEEKVLADVKKVV